MNGRPFFDTNVVLYGFRKDDLRSQVAESLLSGGGALSGRERLRIGDAQISPVEISQVLTRGLELLIALIPSPPRLFPLLRIHFRGWVRELEVFQSGVGAREPHSGFGNRAGNLFTSYGSKGAHGYWTLRRPARIPERDEKGSIWRIYRPSTLTVAWPVALPAILDALKVRPLLEGWIQSGPPRRAPAPNILE